MADEAELSLHWSVFGDDVKRVSQLVRTCDVGSRDKHGNTPLHIAVMLGRKDCVQILLAHGAPVRVKNNQGWSPLAEAISYGDRQTVKSMLRRLKQQSRDMLDERRPALIQALRGLDDFYLELKWDFHSWVPIVSRLLPSDVCKIYKKGCCIRVDSTLIDFNDMKWERGDITFIFNGEAKPRKSLTVLDNKQKIYQRIRNEESDLEYEDEVDVLMSSDIMNVQMSTKKITFSRAQKGWFFKEDKTEFIGSFNADFYIIHGMILESRKRREHLSNEDVEKNKAIMENLTKGNLVDDELQRRPSLRPPPETTVTWEEYISSDVPPVLGRHIYCKESRKHYKATLAMSEDFPVTLEALMDILEIIAPFKHFTKLRDFLTNKLPPGFPIKLEIPVFPTVMAKVTFQDFEWRDDLQQTLFYIPREYKEDPNRFPDL